MSLVKGISTLKPSEMGSLPRLSVLMGERRGRGASETALHRQLEQNIRLSQCGENLALSFTDETREVRLSYDELNARASSVARVLAAHARRSRPNPDGDYIVAVCMQPSHSTVVTLLAAWKAGAAYVPLEPSFPQARVTHILTDSKPVLLVYDESAKPSMFAASGVPAMSYEQLCEQAAGETSDNLQPAETLEQPDNIALVLYTSGSTGIPKGVRLSHAAVSNRVWWQFRRFPFAVDECVCAWKTALTFVDSVCEIWAPLLRGRTLLALSRDTSRDPQKLVAVLSKHEVQRLVLVPTLLRSILMSLSLTKEARPLRRLRLWVCSGEVLTRDLAALFFSHFGDGGYRLANFYGSTEVMGDVTFHVMESAAQLENFASIPIGTPLDNCAIYLLDSEMAPVREGETGELWVSGDNLASGYVGGQGGDKFRPNPHATHPGFGRLYNTGDFGVIEKGTLLYAGRKDSQIKIRGHRIDLQEVNAAVSALAGVDKCVVLCYGAETASPALLACVTLQEGARTSAARVEAALRDKLTHYMIPQVLEVENIPLLVNGKVDRQALLKMYENTNNNDDATIPVEIDYTGVAPEEMAKAEVLFTTVGEVVGRSLRGALALSSNFYELGGDSLNSIYTITQLRERGYYIEISDFLGANNLGEVLSLMDSAPSVDGGGRGRQGSNFTPEPLADHHKDAVIQMVVSSFYEKADLERWLRSELQPEDYGCCVRACWEALLAARLSTVLKDSVGSPVAVALNFDARREPDIELAGALAKIMQFLEHVEGRVRDTMLPEGEGAILHSFMMATAATLSARENVAAIRALEHATLRSARERRYQGVFTTNTSPLTQQLGRDVLGFQTLLDYQVNQYVDPDGVRIFAQAPDDQRVIVCWKQVD